MSLLYLDHFGLSKPPFQITPDLDFFFSGGRRGDILSALQHVARHDEGISTLVAEVGSGKTLLARLMIARLGQDVCTVYLANPCFSRDEIISAIGRDLGLTQLAPSTEEKLANLHQELLRRHAAGQRVLLVVDEAHAMPAESLEEVRLLSNLETGHHKLINIMLFGQPELDALLSDPRLRQVRDRVIHRFELLPLPRDEAAAYIDHRLRAAGWHGGKLFSSTAQNLLLKASGGRARRINLLADKALLAAYADGSDTVQERHVKNATSELQDNPVPTKKGRLSGWWAVALPSAALAVIMTLGTLWLMGVFRDDRTPGVTAQVAPPPTPEARPANSAPIPRTALVTTGSPGLKSGVGAGYTIQLATLASNADPDKYLRFVGQYLDASATHVQRHGKGQMAVYFGRFETEQLAQQALKSLPQTLQVNQPIVRTWEHISQEQKP